MIKNQALFGVREAAALVNTTLGILMMRQNVIRLSPLAAASNPGYVWKRVFLKRKRQP
jgi:hypothetical protein